LAKKHKKIGYFIGIIGIKYIKCVKNIYNKKQLILNFYKDNTTLYFSMVFITSHLLGPQPNLLGPQAENRVVIARNNIIFFMIFYFKISIDALCNFINFSFSNVFNNLETTTLEVCNSNAIS